MHLVKVDDGIFINLDNVIKIFVQQRVALASPDDNGIKDKQREVIQYRVVAKTADGAVGTLQEGFHTVQDAEEWIIKLGKGKIELNDISRLNQPPVKPQIIVPSMGLVH